jgi:hypothetical protein
MLGFLNQSQSVSKRGLHLKKKSRKILCAPCFLCHFMPPFFLGNFLFIGFIKKK